MNPYERPPPGYPNAPYPPPAGGFGANPYAPPVQPMYGYGYGAGAPTGGGGFVAKWVAIAGYCGTLALMFVLTFAAQAVGPDTETGRLITELTPLSMLGIFVYFVAAFVWLYSSWAFLPPDCRFTSSGRPVSPGGAIGFLFVPFYNWYWIFVANVGFCEALDRALAARGRPPSAPRGLAMACCIVQLIPYVNFAIGPLLWMTYMILTDKAKAELRQAG